MRNDLLGCGRRVLEAAGVFHVATDTNTPGDNIKQTDAFMVNRLMLLAVEVSSFHRHGQLLGESSPQVPKQKPYLSSLVA